MENRHVSERLAASIMARYPEADQYPFASWSYPQGFVLWGFIRLYEATGKPEYLAYVRDYGEKHVSPDGTIDNFTGKSLDDTLTASVLVWLAQETDDPRFEAACRSVRAAYDDYPRNADGGFWHSRTLAHEMWIDGLFMGLMFLARYGRDIDDGDWCFRETVSQLRIAFQRCRKDGTGLLYHAYSEDRAAAWASRITGCSPEVWSEGLGWYAMALVEALDVLPIEWPGREELEQQLRLLLDDLVVVQDRVCGLWAQVVDRPKTRGNFFETSGSAMFLYALVRARDLEIVSGPKYDVAIEKAYRGILQNCYEGLDGTIHVKDACRGLCVQGTYEDYVSYPRTVDAQEAVAAVLWALVAVEFGCC